MRCKAATSSSSDSPRAPRSALLFQFEHSTARFAKRPHVPLPFPPLPARRPYLPPPVCFLIQLHSFLPVPTYTTGIPIKMSINFVASTSAVTKMYAHTFQDFFWRHLLLCCYPPSLNRNLQVAGHTFHDNSYPFISIDILVV